MTRTLNAYIYKENYATRRQNEAHCITYILYYVQNHLRVVETNERVGSPGWRKPALGGDGQERFPQGGGARKRLGLGDLALGQMRNAPSASHPWEGAQCIAHLSERAFAVLKASVGSASLKRSARCWQNHLSKTSSISDALTSEVCARVAIAAARAQLAKGRGGGGGRASALSPKRLRRS